MIAIVWLIKQLTSLTKKRLEEILLLKVDISMAFDTLSWDFLIKILTQFGFNQFFCHWIYAILSSA